MFRIVCYSVVRVSKRHFSKNIPLFYVPTIRRYANNNMFTYCGGHLAVKISNGNPLAGRVIIERTWGLGRRLEDSSFFPCHCAKGLCIHVSSTNRKHVFYDQPVHELFDIQFLNVRLPRGKNKSIRSQTGTTDNVGSRRTKSFKPSAIRVRTRYR